MEPFFEILRRENPGKYQQLLSSVMSELNCERTRNNEGDTCSAENPLSSDDPKQPVQRQKHLQIQCPCQLVKGLDFSQQRSLFYQLLEHALGAARCDEIKKASRHENAQHQPAQSEEQPGLDVDVNSNDGIQTHLQSGSSAASISNENSYQRDVQTAGSQKFGETEAAVCLFCDLKL